MQKVIIFDLDGTLANLDHRLPLVKNQPKNWQEFFNQVDKDSPIWHIVRICQWLEKSKDWRIIIASGRSDECKPQTLDWLSNHAIRFHKMYMRKAGDYRQDYEVKKDILKEIKADGYDPMLVFDDRKQVVDMWREHGIPCCQVAPGDF